MRIRVDHLDLDKIAHLQVLAVFDIHQAVDFRRVGGTARNRALFIDFVHQHLLDSRRLDEAASALRESVESLLASAGFLRDMRLAVPKGAPDEHGRTTADVIHTNEDGSGQVRELLSIEPASQNGAGMEPGRLYLVDLRRKTWACLSPFWIMAPCRAHGMSEELCRLSGVSRKGRPLYRGVDSSCESGPGGTLEVGAEVLSAFEEFLKPM